MHTALPCQPAGVLPAHRPVGRLQPRARAAEGGFGPQPRDGLREAQVSEACLSVQQVEQIGARWGLCRWGKVGLTCAVQARLAQLQNRNSWTWLSGLRGWRSGAAQMSPIRTSSA